MGTEVRIREDGTGSHRNEFLIRYHDRRSDDGQQSQVKSMN